MRKKLKPFSGIIIGILIITAFFRGPALDTALIIFFALFLIYSVITKYIKKKGTAKGGIYRINLTPKADKLLKCAAIIKFRRIFKDAVSKIIR